MAIESSLQIVSLAKRTAAHGELNAQILDRAIAALNAIKGFLELRIVVSIEVDVEKKFRRIEPGWNQSLCTQSGLFYLTEISREPMSATKNDLGVGRVPRDIDCFAGFFNGPPAITETNMNCRQSDPRIERSRAL